jgi:uncharacterized iron-regulated protein
MISIVLIAATPLLQPPSAAPVPAPIPRLVYGLNGQDVPIETAVADLRWKDVVVLGEEHDNTPGHRFFADFIARLHQARPDMAISMEQFERDVQGVVNDYLHGKIDEKDFLKHCRPWKNYDADYKPQIELARRYRLDVIAGNIPRPVASRYVTSDNPIALFKPSMTTAPSDAYWVNFKETMKGHPGSPGGPSVEGMYRAQCAKDDAMAESIADYLASRPHRKPIVVHRCGNFHCEYGLGTVSRLLQRSPLLQVGVVSMASVPDVGKPDLKKHLRKAHYLLVVPEMPKKPTPAKSPAPPAKSTTTPPKTPAQAK